MASAGAIRDDLVKALIPQLGPVVGYKAGLTSAPAQARFGVSTPVRGTLLRDMLLQNGATLDAAFGARPMVEGDLLVRVRSGAIHDATTRAEALAALDMVIPFLELPDLMVAPGVSLDGNAITAINVGARYGIMGMPIPLSGDGWLERFGKLEVMLLDQDGDEIATGGGADLLGHPMEVVLWLARSLERDGIRLKPGDLLSLGSLTPLIPAREGRVRAIYKGLSPAGDMEIRVRFR